MEFLNNVLKKNFESSREDLERQQRQKASTDKRILNNMEPVFVRNTIKKIWEPGVVLNRPNPNRELRTYIVDINNKVYYRTGEHLKPRSNNMPREVNEHFELPIQPLTPVASSSTDITPVSTPTKDETPKSPLKPPTPVKLLSPVKLSARKETTSYQPKSVTTRSERTTQVPPNFKE